VRRENIFKPTTGSESLHRDRNDNGAKIVNFATSKILDVKSKMFGTETFISKAWTSHDGKTHNHSDHILIYRRWLSSILNVRSFSGADCDTIIT